MNRLERLYAIAEELRAAAPRLLTVSRLAAQHQVSERTIQRDLQSLLASGLPVRWQEGRGGGWTVDPTMSLAPINLSAEEASALLLSVLGADPHTPLAQAAHSALAKIRGVLTSQTLDALNGWQQRVVSKAASEPTPADDVLEVIQRSVSSLTAVELDYRDAEQRVSSRVVEPVGLLIASSQWYLIAFCRSRQAIRGFRLDRVLKASLGNEKVRHRDLREVLSAEGMELR
ncbi:helix-turn-helix transcriptional regulator [Psychromicrobium lacuslunae]|uniref:Transcriptional regulator n=1 Tax=Psychromicrobium lacuslunae TaxID=1618207 RepID=A0A0D4BZQ0_9MICC|nr:YafY family protein [Psychromicrobium lacuslunae]AJT41803.1 hypothetical protein UM93_10225 [Psychromicrobium lacuslunae]